MQNEKLKELIFERPISVNEDKGVHKKKMLRGFIATTIYSILYGMYEYFIVLNHVRLVDLLGSVEINWLIMYIGVIITVALVTGFSVEQAMMGWFYMAIFEDVIYWFSQWADTGTYPYPAGNWWDNTIATYRVLGGLGQAIPIWPYVPLYYLPGFAMISAYYIAYWIGPKYSRIVAWIISPLFLAIIIGALGDDTTAFFVLIIIPSVSYVYGLMLLYFHKKSVL